MTKIKDLKTLMVYYIDNHTNNFNSSQYLEGD